MTLQFLGYALPGTVMFFFGVGWCWGHALPALPATWTPGARRHKTFPRLLRLDRHPVQGVLKLVVSLVGIVGSLFAAYPDGSFQYVGDVPFATVYLFFALSGAADVLACYWPAAVSRGHARLVLALAFFMEAFLFHGVEVGLAPPQSTAEGRHSLHLLVAVMVTCGLATAMGAVLERGREVADAVRCAGCVVHGTWLYHCGVLLYWPPAPPPPTPSEEAGSLAQQQASQWVTLCFAWHCAAAASLLLVFLVGRRSPCSKKRRAYSPPVPLPYPFGSPQLAAPLAPHVHGVHGPRGLTGLTPTATPTSPHSPHHSCVLCDASTTASYHRSGSLV